MVLLNDSDRHSIAPFECRQIIVGIRCRLKFFASAISLLLSLVTMTRGCSITVGYVLHKTMNLFLAVVTGDVSSISPSRAKSSLRAVRDVIFSSVDLFDSVDRTASLIVGRCCC